MLYERKRVAKTIKTYTIIVINTSHIHSKSYLGVKKFIKIKLIVQLHL